MARTIAIDANILFDALGLIDDRIEYCKDQGERGDAEEWQNDADTIREALGIEIDGEGEEECDRHGGPWGDDETCEQCTTEDGDPRTH